MITIKGVGKLNNKSNFIDLMQTNVLNVYSSKYMKHFQKPRPLTFFIFY